MHEKLTLRPGDEIELTIDTLAFGGEGIGKILLNGKAFTVFVEETVPGDQVKVHIQQKKKNWARGFLKEIIQPSHLRIQPRCRHFGSPYSAQGKVDLTKGCGGCTWQFLSYPQQLSYKEKQVREAIHHLGGIEKEVVLPILGMKEPWFYRNKMEFSFSKKISQENEKRSEEITLDIYSQNEKSEIGLGFHLKRRHYDVIELSECFLLAPYAGDLVREARAFFQHLYENGKIDNAIKLQSLTLREAKNTGEIMLILNAENGEPTFIEDFKQWALKFFATQKIPLTSLFFLYIVNKKGQRKSTTEHLLHGKKTIQEQLRINDGKILKFEISPQAFFQPNTKQAEVLYQKALEAAQLQENEIVYDLFCGTGTIGIFCAHKARKVYGIELNASAIENARANAALNNCTNIEFFVGDVDKNLIELKEKPDVVIVDPPRNGLEPKVIEKIVALRPQRIVYVSCNPATLARDIKIFRQQQYILQSVQPVDMFPQTYHIENVALLQRE